METASQTFDKIFAAGDWKPIKNCPGRFIPAIGSSSVNAEEIVGENTKIFKFISKKAPDEVLVVKFESGGLISHVKENGKFLHTLNNEDGFIRKLEQLGIERKLLELI